MGFERFGRCGLSSSWPEGRVSGAATKWARAIWLIMLCTVVSTGAGLRVAVAQMNMMGHDMGTTREIPAPEKLPAPLRMSGIGNSHLAITAKPEAQVWFDQGLNLLHDFWDYESVKAFEQGVRTDPNCAMCYWGLYQALIFRNGGAKVYADQALTSAVRLKGKAGGSEQLYIEAAVAREEGRKPEGSGSEPDNEKEIAVWRRLVNTSPQDLQAKIFLAESLRDGFDDAGEPKKKTKEEIAVLESVLKAAPKDSAANHYWIHAMEPSSHPERALEAATVLASLAPASGHMVHMPGHIFYRVGDYKQAEHWFAESTATDERYMREQSVQVDNDWNYVHNLMYGIANLMEEGKLREATTLSGKLTGARGDLAETLYIGSPRDGIARLDAKLPIALRTGDWAGVLKMLEGARPEARLENLTFLAGQLREFAGGMQAVERGDIPAGEAASMRLDAQLWRLSQRVKDFPQKPKDEAKLPALAKVMPDANAAPLLSTLSIMSLELRAGILVAQKNLAEAKALFDEAAKEEKALGYREPPAYIRPVREAEGVMLLRAKDFAGAHTAYAGALEARPNSGFPLYGMARSSEAAGDTASARAEYEKFSDAWKEGDAGMPEMAHAREYLASRRAVASAAGVGR